MRVALVFFVMISLLDRHKSFGSSNGDLTVSALGPLLIYSYPKINNLKYLSKISCDLVIFSAMVPLLYAIR